MSGPMPQAVAQAATTIALRAQADAQGVHPGKIIAGNLRAMLGKRQSPEVDSLPNRTWRELPHEIRTMLVMMAAEAPGDPRALARQPWDSFPEKDRQRMGACARDFHHALRDAAALW
jgi:hypothetical protein